MPATCDVSTFAEEIDACCNDPNPLDAFNENVLGRIDESRPMWDGSYLGQYWRAQREICEAMWDDSVTTVAVVAGHSTGKSYAGAGIILGWLTLHDDSLVISTGPSNNQIRDVLWKEVRRAVNGSVLKDYGRLTQNPQKFSYGDGNHALGFATDEPERMQGHHARGPLLVVVDEASGVENPEIWATMSSLKPAKRLLFSNPIRPQGPFYDVCQRAARDPSVRLIHVPSTDSPDIDRERSERGLADAAWLREMEGEYGVDSLVWRVRVLARFPEDATEGVFRRAWLEEAALTIHVPSGPCRTSVDVGLGNGGDSSVVFTRDDNGVLACEAGNTWSLEATAKKVAAQARKFGVKPHHVSFDVEGIGADFDNRLRAEGIVGARPYRAGKSGMPQFANLRAAAAWACRKRLDPGFNSTTRGGLMIRQTPFSLARVPKESLRLLTKELLELRYELGPHSEVRLEKAEDYAIRLKHSPDHQSAFCQSWAFDAPEPPADPPTAKAGVGWPFA